MHVRYGQSITLDKETDTFCGTRSFQIRGTPQYTPGASIFHITFLLIEQFIPRVNAMGLVQGSQFSNSGA